MKVFQFRLPERTLISTGRRESDGNQALDATEDLEVVILTAEETKQLLADGGLVQAVHVAAMYYAEKRLTKGKAGVNHE